MKKFSFSALLIIFTLFLLIFIFSILQKEKTQIICTTNNICFNAYIANSPREKTLGLTTFEKLGENETMLFVFEEEDYYFFWMKDMKFPIDIIWLNSERKIVHIEKNLQPCEKFCQVFTSNEKAKYVLEINSNLTNRYNIKVNDSLVFINLDN